MFSFFTSTSKAPNTDASDKSIPQCKHLAPIPCLTRKRSVVCNTWLFSSLRWYDCDNDECANLVATNVVVPRDRTWCLVFETNHVQQVQQPPYDHPDDPRRSRPWKPSSPCKQNDHRLARARQSPRGLHHQIKDPCRAGAWSGS